METTVVDRRPEWLKRLHDWRVEHVSERMFMIILALLVGFFAAVAAFVLHWIINQIVTLLTSSFNQSRANWLYLVYPVVGIYLTSLFVRYIVKDNISHGITRILYAISSNRSRLKSHNCWSSVIASAITIGFGGSVGAEAPIVLTGSAIGSNLGQLFHLDRKMLMTLVGCGAAGAIAGIFKAPIAGLVFTLEVLMIDMTMSALLPILVSCVTATVFTYIFSGDSSLFTFHLDSEWSVERIPACIGLGIACGLVSLYFIRMMGACEDVFSKFKDKPYVKLAIGGTTLSLLIFLFPALYGEGYSSINLLLNGQNADDWNRILNNSMFSGQGSLLLVYIALVLFTKVVATSATNGGGGCGGTFAPSLFIGCFTGFLFSRLWNINSIGVYVPEKNFALLGMAGVMSGVMHAPLTGIFLIAELTGGYSMFMPLMIVSVVAYMTISIFEPHSIYGSRLAKQGKLLTHHTDHAVLTLMNLDSVIERDYLGVEPDMELNEIVHKISRSHSTVLPVLDAGGKLLGEIDIMKIRNVVFRIELYHHFKASQLMTDPKALLTDGMQMRQVMRTFDRTGANWLPVLDAENRLKGYISRQRIYTMYRKMVADMSED
ncbi:chloride channel protein [Xylanibacter ruminicola]|uniref:Voltage-gated chloride channel family protein n=2 Tax=Xylanibacter ruminicola TaxID=839 RepID=D5EW71_XYLR2|nr:chloride channel protein [Xylanibacter ruminicola]MBQ6054086.1 chloride channel protein [Prevotella sp.]ADE81952.1 voltage-gated chloride channel family protein [Xylanibacter ruminicola 23]MBR0187217.1 chloride channel protein [Prevotella sp.]SEH96552.1 chloride channel protein, CIC family [Xylanibacter ruminicola]GJG32638.1 chloride channel protein [Xylanibacter ruminicola]